jgi:hypothetical protein
MGIIISYKCNAIHHFDHPNMIWHSSRVSILDTKYLYIQTEILVLMSMQISQHIDIAANAMPSLPIQTYKYPSILILQLTMKIQNKLGIL